MSLTVDQLAAELWAHVGSDAEAFTEAWRQAHYAAQAVAEVGKSWGEPREDDAHSALLFDPEDETWCSPAADRHGGVRARLDLGAGVITIDRDEPGEGAWIDPTGRTLETLRHWVRSTAERLTDAPADQDAQPAPGLPEHELGEGGRFWFDDAGALSQLETLYTFAADLLARTAEAVHARTADGEDELMIRLWPLHFDGATLAVLSRVAGGNMIKTIGGGLTPPDETEGSGYFYVSAWRKDGESSEAPTLSPMPHGRWEMRGGGSAMAVLPISEIAQLDDASDQSERIAAFVAAAFNTCEEMLGHG